MSEVTRTPDCPHHEQGDPHAAVQLQLLPLVYDEHAAGWRAEARTREAGPDTSTRWCRPSTRRTCGWSTSACKRETSDWDRPGGLLRRHGRGPYAHPRRECSPQTDSQTRRRSGSGGHGTSRRFSRHRSSRSRSKCPSPFTRAARRPGREVAARLKENSSNCVSSSAAPPPRHLLQILGIAPATAEEDWTYAKAWLRRQWLRGDSQHQPDA